MSASIAVIVVAFNSSSTIEGCLRGLMLDPAVVSIAVVDNASDRNTRVIVDRVRTHYPGQLDYVVGQGNVGFARGCNLGARTVASADFVAFVNPDVELTGRLSSLIPAIEHHSAAIVAAGLSGHADVEFANARRQLTLKREFVKVIRGSRVYMYRAGLPNAGPAEFGIRVAQVDGALMLMTRETFEKLGGFDERFELYYEDVDLSIRARELGGTLFVPIEIGRHLGGVSSGSVRGSAYSVLRVSRTRLLRKLYGRSAVLTVVLFLLSLIEFFARSITRQAEPQKVRVAGLKAQLAELRRPGKVKVLDTGDFLGAALKSSEQGGSSEG